MSGLGLQTSKPAHRSNRCGAGRWVASWECHISASALASAPAPAPGTPLVCQSRTPTPRVGFASGRPTLTDSDLDFSGHGHGLGVTFTASPVVVVCTEGTPCSQRGRTLTVTLILILEPPVSGARRHWGRNHCANIDIHINICAVCGENCVEFPL